MGSSREILTKLSGDYSNTENADTMGMRESTNMNDAMLLLRATAHTLSNPSLTIPFFWGPIYPNVPHVRAGNPFGYFHFTLQNSREFTSAAMKTENKLATFWSGPFPILYVAGNKARHALIRESHIGVTDANAQQYLYWLSGGNNVMATFPDFRAIDSTSYKNQRQFLLKLFHGGAKNRVPTIYKATSSFLSKHHKDANSLRAFITRLVLHTSSYLLGLTEYTLDNLYDEPKYRDAIRRVAFYGVSERANLPFEQTLYDLFLLILKNNFNKISHDTPETNLIRNIFHSINVAFPKTLNDFQQLPENVRHTIAMNFASTGLGAMVHSTANTLDWAIARLLNAPEKMAELTQLMATHKNLDLTQETNFDKSGLLSPLCEWVLHNVFLYPAFSHEIFLTRKAFATQLPDGSTIQVPSMSFIAVNYASCNQSQTANDAPFSTFLKDNSTVGKFVMDSNVASFGGSKTNRENRHTRLCPGAKTSLYEQMLIIAILLRDYAIHLNPSEKLSCNIDPNWFPLYARVDEGEIQITRTTANHDNGHEMSSSCTSTSKTHRMRLR